MDMGHLLGVLNYCYYEQYYTSISMFIKENNSVMLGVFLGNSWFNFRVGIASGVDTFGFGVGLVLW